MAQHIAIRFKGNACMCVLLIELYTALLQLIYNEYLSPLDVLLDNIALNELVR